MIKTNFSTSNFLYFILILACFSVSACQKENLIPDSPMNQPVKSVSLRTETIETQVLESTQWLVRYAVPLMADESVKAQILAGNTNAAVVISKLQALNFTDFNDFTNQCWQNTAAVRTAIQTGVLTAGDITSILSNNRLSILLGPFGGGPVQPMQLPCYDQLCIEVEAAFFLATLAMPAGPFAFGATLAVGVAVAWHNYTNCMEGNYP